jgi:hypothetical protein
MHLFEITDQLKQLERIADSGEIAPEIIADTLEGLEGDFESKAVAVAKFILSLEATSDAAKDAAKAMRERADRIAKRADCLRNYLLLQFQIVDWRKKIESAEVTIARRNNPVAVQVTDAESVPAEYWVQPPPPPPQLDKKAIKSALQSGISVPGVYLESGERIEIKL